MSFMDNVTNPIDIITGIGAVLPASSQFLIGHLFLLAFFMIFFILAKRYDTSEVIIINGFITTIIAILFYFAGMIPVTTIIYPAILFFITLVFYLFQK